MFGSWKLRSRRVAALRIDAELSKSLLRPFRVEVAIARQPGKRCRHDGLGADLEVPPQMLAVIAAPEAISSQRHQTVQQPGGELIRHHLHIVGSCNDGTRHFAQRTHDEWLLRL